MLLKIKSLFFIIILLLTFNEANASCTNGEANQIFTGDFTVSQDCSGLWIRGKEEKTITVNSGITVNEVSGGKRPLTIHRSSITSSIINNGRLIESRDNQSVILMGRNSLVELFENNGTIEGTQGIRMVNREGSGANEGHIEVFTNTGTIKQTRDIPGDTDSDTHAGLLVKVWARITTLNNSGDIRSSWQTVRNEGIIENFNNTGTITTDRDDDGTVDNGKAIVNARDADSPASWYANQSFEKRKIGTLTNSGTIEATVNTIHNTGLIETINNSGNITATGNRAIYNKNENDGRNFGEIDTLINSGTISANNQAIHNTGTITTIINTGSIVSTSSYSIKNEGDITTLTNSQGASGSALTYTGTVPTNYNVKVNSASDFGKIAFTSISGSLNFDVASESELAGGTTYSSIMTGISSGSITGQSGTHLNTSGDRIEWSLENGGDTTTWNLVTESAQSIAPPTNCSINSSLPGCTSDDEDIVSTVEVGMNNLTNVVNVNFAHMNTYDCDTFGKNGMCISLGARNTKIKNPNSETKSLVFVFGKKLSENYRFAVFHHSNHDHDTPSNFTLRDETPLLGVLGVWNENSDKSGLQIKLGTAHQVKHATIIRKQVGISEQAEGNTTLTAWNLITELKYNIMVTQSLELSPYFAGRYAEKIQDGYTEEEVTVPLTYNDIKDKSVSVVGGLKFKKDFGYKFNIFGSGGVEYDIYHDISNLKPTGISGITSVDLSKNFNRTRPVVSLGFNINITEHRILRLNAQYEELSYKGMSEKNLYLSYNIGF